MIDKGRIHISSSIDHMNVIYAICTGKLDQDHKRTREQSAVIAIAMHTIAGVQHNE